MCIQLWLAAPCFFDWHPSLLITSDRSDLVIEKGFYSFDNGSVNVYFLLLNLTKMSPLSHVPQNYSVFKIFL